MTTRTRLIAGAVVLWAIAIAAGSIRLGISFRTLLLGVMVLGAIAMAALVIAVIHLNRAQHRAGLLRHAHIEATGGYEALVERSAATETARTTV